MVLIAKLEGSLLALFHARFASKQLLIMRIGRGLKLQCGHQFHLIFEKNPTKIKNYGIWLRYQSRTGYHNMYKEYRDTTLNGVVEQMYIEMASRYRVQFPCIQIFKTTTIPAKLCKRDSTKQLHNSKIHWWSRR
ncbi:60S ribosomal protein L18a-like [Gossypium arboreum]|uniref:60S ribosomal protein L18a-like n=1 Tax=Gossypium arboreum TaxID=29729 RepID=UPI0008196977|nr:60S ribosomal protein L18a-like [Gossypium arboreum]